MSNSKTTLGWADATWSPVSGCEHSTPGCRFCYAPPRIGTMHQQHGSKRRVPELYRGIVDKVKGRYVFNGVLKALPPEHEDWTWPLRWPGAEFPKLGIGKPSLISVVILGDLFVGHRPVAIIDKVVGTLIESRHIGLLLNKGTARMAAYFSALPESTRRKAQARLWLGFSAERQQEFNAHWAHMRPLAEAGWFVFVSIAPMIEPVQLPDDFLALGKWVIVSGEIGARRDKVRRMDPDWARAIRDHCAAADIPFFLLQMTSKRRIPLDLWVRQFPAWPADRAAIALRSPLVRSSDRRGM